MNERTFASSPRFKARVAGFLYLIVIAGGAFALTIRSGLIVRSDAAASAANVMASELMYRLSFVADLVASACYIGVAVILYELLKPVSRTVSLLAAFFALAGCVVGSASSVNVLAPLALLGDATYLTSFGPDQLKTLALASYKLYVLGFLVAMTFFGVYCLLLGYLILSSTFLPRILGALLTVAGLAWLLESVATFLSPPLANALSYLPLAAGGLGEGAFALWLFFVGVNEAKWRRQVAE